MPVELFDHVHVLRLKNFRVSTLALQSRVLKDNPWGDSSDRRHILLLPKQLPRQGTLPLVLVLSGYSGNGPAYLSPKGFEDNFAEVLDREFSAGRAPQAAFCLVDAWTQWGGSQFINSKGMGRYEDHIIRELIPAIGKHVMLDETKACVMGGSSGGYGALHLASSYPDIFPWVAALAPDSFFEMSLLPDIYRYLPTITQLGGVAGVYQQLRSGKLHKRRDMHSLINTIAMGLCYSPEAKNPKDVVFPLDERTGVLDLKKWVKWKSHDPLEFLPKRKANLKKLKGILLDVGSFDQYFLHWGARQLSDLLRRNHVPLDYSEFDGNHFDISSRRPVVWKWLKKKWE